MPLSKFHRKRVIINSRTVRKVTAEVSAAFAGAKRSIHIDVNVGSDCDSSRNGTADSEDD